MSNNVKDLRQYLRELRNEGWTITMSAKAYKLIPPSGKGFVFCALTPSCHRALDNIKAEVRRLLKSQANPQALQNRKIV